MMRILHHLLFLCFLLNLGASSAQYSPGPESPTSPPYYSLPEDEVSALQNLLMDLGSAETVDSSFCSLIDTSVGPLQVDLLFPSNSNACHIQNISRSSSSYSRRSSLGASSVTYLSPESAYASINPSVANLTFLQKLDLSNMGLQSSIPESLGELSKLQYLDLSYNQLTGGMTMIDKVQSLSYLDLSYNLLEGKIPNLTNLVDLTTLILRFNKLEGNIPDALGNQILKLEYLGLNENQLEGKLPDALGNLRNLRLFDVGSNNITGTIPESFHQLTSLEYFGVYGNNMSGPIRPFFTNWKNLRKL